MKGSHEDKGGVSDPPAIPKQNIKPPAQEPVDHDGVHQTHCCILHHCKYNEDDDCPVVKKRVKQAYTCEDCDQMGIRGLDDLEKYLSDKSNSCPHCGHVLKEGVEATTPLDRLKAQFSDVPPRVIQGLWDEGMTDHLSAPFCIIWGTDYHEYSTAGCENHSDIKPTIEGFEEEEEGTGSLHYILMRGKVIEHTWERKFVLTIKGPDGTLRIEDEPED